MPLQLLLFYGQNVLKFCLLGLSSGAPVSSFRNLAQPWDIIVTKMTGLTLLVLGRVVTGLVWPVSLTPAGLNNIFLFAAVR